MQYSSASYEQMLVPTSDGSGWKLVSKNGGPEQMLPGSVALNGDTYQLQQKLASSNNVLYTVLKGTDGKLYSDAPSTQDAAYHQLDIQPGDLIGARSNLQAALTCLRESQGDYASYGVVFPDIFKANDDQFISLFRVCRGFQRLAECCLLCLEGSLFPI